MWPSQAGLDTISWDPWLPNLLIIKLEVQIDPGYFMLWLYEDNSFIGVQLEENLKYKEDINLEWTFYHTNRVRN